jgi:cytochrome c biogenesis protein CcmG/thiol:disulfide interchange protein DsbE
MLLRIFPFLFFLGIAVVLVSVTNMQDNPKLMPNMIGHKLEAFDATELFTGEKITSADLIKEPAIINIFASWCVACRAEHEQLMALKDLNLYGLNSGDKPDLAKAYLSQMGNPFKKVLSDPLRDIAIKMGSTGTPETYVVGPDGKIYYHYRGNLTDELVQTKLKPIYDVLVYKNSK